MPDEIPFSGFQYDQVKALAMADAVIECLALAKDAGATVPDRLAALGIAVARIVMQSRLQQDPEVAITRLAVYERLVVAQLQEAARRATLPPAPG